MKKNILYELVFVLLLSLTAFIATNNLYVFIFVLVIFSLYSFLILNINLKKYVFASTRYQECYNFINTFILSLSSTNSLIASFEAATKNPSEQFLVELNGIEQLEVIEKIKYLDRFFPFHTYLLFIDVMNIFNEQGGDILYMSKYLIKESRLKQDYIEVCKNLAFKKIVELIVLWSLSLSILIILRFGLSTFYLELSKQIFYPISICAYFLIFLIFFHFSIKALIKIDIKGMVNYEQVKR